MTRVLHLSACALLLAGCAAPPELTPWRADTLVAGLPPGCTTGAAAPEPATVAANIMPGGISVVRSEGRDVVLVAARTCVMVIDTVTGAAQPLPTRGDSIAPTMLDATSDGVAFSSSLSGTVRAINTAGAVIFNKTGLQYPLGVRLLPGGAALVADYGTGRLLHVGPGDDSRPRLIAEGLEGPVGVVIVDATRGYVSEYLGGRVTGFRLDRFEKATVVSGLKHPEGIALLPDGRLAVAEVGQHRLVAIQPETGTLSVMADKLPIGLESPMADKAPVTITDLAFAPDGSLYVTSDVDRTVLKVTLRPKPTK